MVAADQLAGVVGTTPYQHFEPHSYYSRSLRLLQIWSALGDANSVATEAFGNIRTVRAFGREETEINKFQESTGLALRNGAAPL